jgi:KaiC domain protein
VSEDDKDWFEAGLEDEEAEATATAARDDTPEDDGDMAADPEPTDTDPEPTDTDPNETTDAPIDGDTVQAADSGTDAAESGPAAGEQASDAGFGGDFAAEFENAPGPAGAGGPDSDPGGPADEFGFDVGDPGGGSAGGEFGFDVDPSGGGAEEEFADAEFESDIPRIDLGIEGLDEMVHGGVPERSLIVTIGGAGTGKTTFGLQFLQEAIQNGERAVFITLEESHDRVVRSAVEKGWDFEAYEADGQLAVIDLDPVDMANSLTSIRNELPRLIEDFGASRLVLDSVSLLEMMYDDQAVRRTEIYDFTKALKRAGVTTMLTSEASEETPFASRHGIIEYLTDAVFVLRYVRPEDFRETRLAVEIQKIRDANHSRETKPYEITNDGISVYRQANIF